MSMYFVIALSLFTMAQDAEPRFEPQWSVRPMIRAQDYPGRALREDLSGSAVIRCHVGSNAVPSNCEILSEDPEGYGFGPAAIGIIQRGRLAPDVVTPETIGRPFSLRIPLILGPAPD